MRVLVLTPYRYGETPGPRSSIELWEKVLSPQGVRFDYQPFETEELAAVIYEGGHYAQKAREMIRAYWKRLRGLGSIDAADAVLVYREAALIGPAIVERIAARKKPIIYQLDDPLYVPYESPFNGRLSHLKFFGKVATICRLSAVTIVNSRQHREYAEESGAGRVVEIPSVVDGDLYRPGQRVDRNGRVRIGWTGSPSTAGNLEMIAAPLRRVIGETGAEVTLVGAGSDEPLPSVNARSVAWAAESEVEEVSQFDVGLLPLPRNPWNERKFFLKLVQYMALGVPAVATPIGAVPDVLAHGETGFLVDGPREWQDRLTQLVLDRELRARMGLRAGEVAAERYTLQANAEKITSAFQAVA